MSQLEGTKTMADAVEAYRKQKATDARVEADRKAELAAETLKVLNKAGLPPLRVEDGNVAVFEYKGQEVRFRIWIEAGHRYMYRIGTCPECGEEINSSERYAGHIHNFGELIVSPYWMYHPCKKVIGQTETAEQRLVYALREVLAQDGE